jgi:hypothetical protein
MRSTSPSESAMYRKEKKDETRETICSEVEDYLRTYLPTEERAKKMAKCRRSAYPSKPERNPAPLYLDWESWIAHMLRQCLLPAVEETSAVWCSREYSHSGHISNLLLCSEDSPAFPLHISLVSLYLNVRAISERTEIE